MESVLTEKRAEITAAPDRTEIIYWEAVQARVEAYLAAWRLGDREWVRECAREIVTAARQRGDCDPIRAAIDEADLFLQRWFQQVGGMTLGSAQGEVSREERLALLSGASGEGNFSDRTQLIAALRQGTLNSNRAYACSRPPETRSTTMQTSLSRLPSIRIIAGWLLLIVSLFLAFILTHHHRLP